MTFYSTLIIHFPYTELGITGMDLRGCRGRNGVLFHIFGFWSYCHDHIHWHGSAIRLHWHRSRSLQSIQQQ